MRLLLFGMILGAMIAPGISSADGTGAPAAITRKVVDVPGTVSLTAQGKGNAGRSGT